MNKEKIYQQIQHRAQLKYLSKELQKFINEYHPEIKDSDMVEVTETRSFQLYNSWDPKDESESTAAKIYTHSVFGTEGSASTNITPETSELSKEDLNALRAKAIRQSYLSSFGLLPRQPRTYFAINTKQRYLEEIVRLEEMLVDPDTTTSRRFISREIKRKRKYIESRDFRETYNQEVIAKKLEEEK